MARRDRTKQRTRQHVIEDLSLNFLERMALQCHFIVESTVHDYGIDARVYTVDEGGHIEADEIMCQLKATDHLDDYLIGNGRTISFPVAKPDILLWTKMTFPVIFVVYDAHPESECAYWEFVQRFFVRNLGIEPTQIQESTRQIHVPTENKLTAAAFRRFREFKMEIQRQIGGRLNYDI